MYLFDQMVLLYTVESAGHAMSWKANELTHAMHGSHFPWLIYKRCLSDFGDRLCMHIVSQNSQVASEVGAHSFLSKLLSGP